MAAERTVAFVCLHGAAKSVIAAEHCARLARERGLALRATAAGTEPSAAIPEAVLAGLLVDGLDARGARPRRATAEALAGAWRVVAFGCDVGALAGGRPVDRWDDVPPVSEGYGPARDAIVARLERLLAEWATGPRA